MKVQRAKGGTQEKWVELKDIQVPGMWHIAQNQEDKANTAPILECWHLCHDLLSALRSIDAQSKKKKWRRGKINVELTVKEMNDLTKLLNNTKGYGRHLKKLVNASDWYFNYPFD
jgi:hypothetical protein